MPKPAADIKIEIAVCIQSLKSRILSHFSDGYHLLGSKANIVAQVNGKFGPWGWPQKPKKWDALAHASTLTEQSVVRLVRRDAVSHAVSALLPKIPGSQGMNITLYPQCYFCSTKCSSKVLIWTPRKTNSSTNQSVWDSVTNNKLHAWAQTFRDDSYLIS